MQEYMTSAQIGEVFRRAQEKKDLGEMLVIKPETVLHILEDLFWRQMSESEYKTYLEECQEIIKDVREMADYESDEWDAVERLGNIRERLGVNE